MTPYDPYHSIAPVYDWTTSRFLLPARQRIAALCEKHGWQRILDSGCGTAELAAMLANNRRQVVATDISTAMLQMSSHKQKPNAQFYCLCADSANLPLKPKSMDVVICSLLLHESNTKPEQLLASAFAVAPTVCVLEWRMPERNLDYLARPFVHAIERLAGKQHYHNFIRFMHAGGIHGLAYRMKSVIIHEEYFRLGTLSLCLLQQKNE